VIQIGDLVKHYSSGGGEVVRALDGVSMSIGPGELVALYGPSGSGKTTLLNVIAALIPPDSGSVRVAGQEISGFSAREAARYRRTKLGYVSQSPDLLSGVPAIANAALKLYGSYRVREAHRQVTPLMERLGLGDRLQHRPDELSAGERQRVLIARALSTDPSLVLADEPTGTLDTRRSSDVLTLLTEVCREREAAMLLVTHDPQAAGYATRINALRDGRLEPYDPAHDALLAGP
jgi:putative ABC transport system ATP-binding protein